MSKLLASDLSSATVQECLAALGPSLIDRFRSEVPAVLEGPSAYAYKGENSDHGWDGHSFGDGPLVRPIVLDEHSRRAKIGLEEVFRWDFDEALDIAFDAVDRAIKVVLADQIVADSPGVEEGSSAEPGSVEGLTTITVNEVRIEEGTVFVRGPTSRTAPPRLRLWTIKTTRGPHGIKEIPSRRASSRCHFRTSRANQKPVTSS